jgi:hypothetical protein
MTVMRHVDDDPIPGQCDRLCHDDFHPGDVMLTAIQAEPASGALAVRYGRSEQHHAKLGSRV